MAELKKVIYGIVRRIENLESVNYPGSGTCLVTVNVFDAEAGGASTVRIYDRSPGAFKYKVGDRVALECEVEFPRPGLRRYIYYGRNRRAS